MNRHIREILDIVRTHLEFEDYEDAERVLHQSLEVHQEDPDLLHALANICLQQKKNDSSSCELYLRYLVPEVVALMNNQQFTSAKQRLEQMHELGAVSDYSLDLYAACHFALGDVNRAWGIWQQIYLKVARMYLDWNQPQFAEERLNFAYERGCKDAETIDLLCAVLVRLDKLDELKQLLKEHDDPVTADPDEESQEQSLEKPLVYERSMDEPIEMPEGSEEDLHVTEPLDELIDKYDPQNK